MYRFLFTLSLVVFFLSVQAQSPAPMKWGDIPPEDLAMTIYPKDSTAQAVVLGDYGVLEVQEPYNVFDYRFRHHMRIKILDKSAADEGDISIPFYHKSNVYGIKAQSISPDGTVHTLEKSAIYEEDIHEFLKIKKFSIPNVQVGSVIEYMYEKRSPDVVSLEKWFFQGELPVRHSEIVLDIPKMLEYTYIFTGTQKKPEDVEVDGLVEVNGDQFIMRNAPALKEEGFITSMDNYRASLRFQLSKIWWQHRPPEEYMSSWAGLAEELHHHYNFGKQYQHRRYFNKAWSEVEPLIENIKDTEERIKVIYQYVQDKLTWNEFYGKYASGSLNEAIKEGKGNVADINLLLVGLLQEADIPAQPALTAFRRSGYLSERYPIIDQFNYVVAYVETDEQPLFLDASSSFYEMGYVRDDALNYWAWIPDQENPYWVELTPEESSDIFWMQLELNNEGDISGKFVNRASGYSAVTERQKYLSTNGDFWKERLENRVPDLTIDSISFENLNDINEPFSTEIQLQWKGASQQVGDFMYLSPVIYTNFDESPLKLEKRLYPVEIPYPFKEQIIINLNVPEGYEVEALPDNVNITFPNKEAQFRYLASVQNNQITITTMTKIQRLIYAPEEYESLKTLFDTMVESLKGQIVLKKV